MQQQRAWAAQIAGKDEAGRLPSFRNFQIKEGRAEDVPRIAVGDFDAGMRFESFVKVYGAHESNGLAGVFRRVESLVTVAFRAAPLVMALLPFLLHFLNMGAVFQHQSGEIQRRMRAVDVSLETLGSQKREEA